MRAREIGILLALAAVAAGCSADAFAAKGRGRGRTKGGAQAVVGGGGGGAGWLERRTPTWSYWASDVSGATWAERNATGPTLTAVDQNALTGRSTTGLENLPAALVDAAVRPDGTGDGYASGAGNSTWTTGDFNVRLVFRCDSPTNNFNFWSHTVNSSYNLFFIGQTDAATQFRYRSVGIFNLDAPAYVNGQWNVADWSIDVDGGAGGETWARACLNGSCNEADDVDSIALSGAAGAFGIMGSSTGTLSMFKCDFLIFDRYDGEILSVADHQSDAEEAGVYTP